MRSSPKLSTSVLAAFACVYLFWGSTYVAIRFGVEVLPPFVLASIRFLIAGPLMLALCALRGLPLGQSRRDFAILAAAGILMLGMGNMALVWSEQYLPSGLAALLLAVIPVYIALLEWLLPGGQGLRARGWIGVGIGFFGLLVLVSPSLREGLHGSALLLGSGVAIAGGFAWACGSILSRRVRVSATPFVAAAWQMLFAGLFNFALMAATGGTYRVRWTAQAVWSIAWLVVFGSLVGYTAYIYLLEHVPVAKVATYAYINPIVAVALGAVLLHERLVAVEYAGSALILAAVYLVTSSKLKPAAFSASAAADLQDSPISFSAPATNPHARGSSAQV